MIKGEDLLQETSNVFEKAIAAIREHTSTFLQSNPDILGLRPTLSNADKVLIQAIYNPKIAQGPLPASLGEFTLVSAAATPDEIQYGLIPLEAWEDKLFTEDAPESRYEPPEPSEVELVEVEINNVLCHVGPDSGWTTLQPFLEATQSTLTVAMYEFYAKHIEDTIMAMGDQGNIALKMILQVTDNGNDGHIPELLNQHWGEQSELVRASVGSVKGIFKNSYHTKVAVRDSSAFWLSSGNWSPNSQPLLNGEVNTDFLYREGNREWHVIVENETLAQIYEKFILYDMRMAASVTEAEAAEDLPDLFVPLGLLETEAAVIQPQPFDAETFHGSGDPIKVMPLMSPDNYAQKVLELIENAEESIYLQFSYIKQPSTETFDRIISTLARRMKDGLDVRIMVGSGQKAIDSGLLVGKRKWKRSMFRQQKSKLHNKGIIIDGKIACVGSNNWSNDGVQFNRDTTLVFHSPEIAAYYTRVFMFDWDNLTKDIPTQQEEMVPVIAEIGEETPPGMKRVSWNEWFNE